MPNGRLKAGFNEKGFAFIVPDEAGPDVFLHVSQLATGEDKSRYIGGSHITFEMEQATVKGIEKAQARNARLAGQVVNPRPGTLVTQGVPGSVKFWQPNGFGFVVDETTGVDYFAHATSVQGGYLRPGDHVTFDVEQHDDRLSAANVRPVAWGPTGDAFTDEVDLGGPNWVVELSELSEKKETWNYRLKPSKDKFVILRSYLKYTYLRQRELDGHLVLAADGSSMAFNTGLVTDFQEEIFAVFKRNDSDADGPPWRLRSFERASSVAFLRVFGGGIPPIAWYYSGPEDLVYDTSIPLKVNVEHVPHDPERFPASLAQFSPEDLAGLVNAKAPEAIERVRRNYKTAIPQFYRDSKNTGTGKMQLLLPVGLVRRDQVELALAVDRLESGVYLGRTVLTLDWAYNNARLLTRPDTDWLQP